MALPTPRDDGAALVTGASSGIGVGIARELAGRGLNLVLVARRKERLVELGEELTAEHGIRVEPLDCDLADEAKRKAIPSRLGKLGLEIDLLVNNAGFATGGPYVDSDPGREVDQVRILVEAVVSLTSMFLPGMVERDQGGIITVASTAGMQPLPYSAGYSAAKAHAMTFSQALSAELSGTGVTATAVCPGPVKTEFWEAAGGDQPIEGALPSPAWVSVDEVAKAAVNGVDKGERVVVPGIAVKAATTAMGFIPEAIKLPISERLFRKSGG